MKKCITKKIFSALLTVVMLLSVVPLGIITVSAYSPRTTAPSTSNAYYYSNNIFYTSGYGMPNCTCYAYGRAYELLGSKPKLSTGNAGAWWKYNVNNGYYPYGSTPKLGAVAVWDKYDDNQGHVAVVEAINGSQVTISESHYKGTFFNTRTMNSNSSNYLTNYRFRGYIYIIEDTSYTISFSANGGSGSMSSFTAKSGVAFSFPSNQFTKTGYKFSGWNLKRNADGKWFVGGVGWETDSEISSKGHSKALYGNNTYWEGGVGPSWLSGCSNATSFTLYAVWTPKDYTISYNSNGGSGSMSSTVARFDKAFSFSTNKFTRSGYTFSGWNLKRNADGKWFVGGVGWETESEMSSKGHSKALYGNNTNWSSGLGSSWTNGCESATSFTLYAVWTPKDYTISYNANGGSGSMSSTVARFDKAFSFSPNKFTRSGYKFSGWNLKRNADGKWFVAGIGWETESEISSKGHSKALYVNNTNWSSGLGASWTNGCESATNFTLYAVWEKAECSHTVVTDPAVAATCTTAGKTAGSHCSKCNAVITAQQTIPATGHSFGAWTTTKAATCTADGMQTRTCSACNHSETKTIAKTGHTVVTDPAVAATCTTAGKTAGSHCSKCNAVITAQQTIPATGHSFGAWTTTKAATCTTDGTQTRTCSSCNHSETKTIAKTGHTVVTDPAVAATCTTAGKTQGSHCSKCNAVITAQQTIPATGHSFGAWTVKTPATATKEGVEERTCHCGAKETRAIPKLGSDKVVSVKLNTNNVDTNYNRSFTLTPNVDVIGKPNYKVSYSSSNTGIATVDANGNVNTVGKGLATITVTVTDSNGNQFKDTCNVKVTFTFAQWLLYIICFGWIWM